MHEVRVARRKEERKKRGKGRKEGQSAELHVSNQEINSVSRAAVSSQPKQQTPGQNQPGPAKPLQVSPCSLPDYSFLYSESSMYWVFYAVHPQKNCERMAPSLICCMLRLWMRVGFSLRFLSVDVFLGGLWGFFRPFPNILCLSS